MPKSMAIFEILTNYRVTMWDPFATSKYKRRLTDAASAGSFTTDSAGKPEVGVFAMLSSAG